MTAIISQLTWLPNPVRDRPTKYERRTRGAAKNGRAWRLRGTGEETVGAWESAPGSSSPPLPNETLSHIVACFPPLPLILALMTTIGRVMIMISGCMAMTMSRFQNPIGQRALAAGE